MWKKKEEKPLAQNIVATSLRKPESCIQKISMCRPQ